MSNTKLQTRSSGLAIVIRDILQGAVLWRLWTTLAWNNLKQRYRRSWIGVGWITMSFILFMGVKIFVFGSMSDSSFEYYAGHLTIGYLIYRLISTAVTAGSGVFVSTQNWIKSEPLPLSVHAYTTTMHNFIVFALSAISALGICAYVGAYSLLGLFFLIPCLIVYAINSFWVIIVFGIISARYRDVMHFSATVMQVLYFLSPVLWIPPETGARAIAAQINPITHYIAILRAPVMDGVIPYDSWLIVMCCTGFGIILMGMLFTFSRRKLIFWL